MRHPRSRRLAALALCALAAAACSDDSGSNATPSNTNAATTNNTTTTNNATQTTTNSGTNSGTTSANNNASDADLPDAPDADLDADSDATPDPDVAPDLPMGPRCDPDPEFGPMVAQDTTALPGPPLNQPLTFDHTTIAQDDDLFALGVASGAARPDGALLWTFLQDAAPARLRVWRAGDPDAGAITLLYDAPITPDDAGYAKLSISGLEPFTWYRYAFVRPDPDAPDTFSARSPIGRFRTALAADQRAPVTVGASTCTSFRSMPYRALSYMAQNEPVDVFVHLGDMSYNDPAVTLNDYRTLWRRTLRDPGYRDILSTTTSLITWDDHEVDNNWHPEREDPDRVVAAKQAFFETLPVERGPDDRLYASYRWGQTVEFIVLDARSERLPTTIPTDYPIYLSCEQLAWLKDRLASSPAHFKVILNSVPITRMPPFWVIQEDRWQGYPAQRQELLDFILDQDIRNVWFLTGDFHVGFVANVEPEGPGRRLKEIAVGPGGNGPNPLPLLAEGGFADFEDVYPTRQFYFGSRADSTNVSTALTFDPDANTVRIRFYDTDTEETTLDLTLSEDD